MEEVEDCPELAAFIAKSAQQGLGTQHAGV
jgi:hypothetical protein